jgi:microcystin degradation protein MlrC
MTKRPSQRRLFLAGMFQETSDFSPVPTSMDSFRAGSWIPDGQNAVLPTKDLLGYAGAWQEAERQGATPVAGPFFSAVPAARMTAALWATLKRDVLQSLSAAHPVDAVFLMLHGAMMASGLDDCEADLVREVRALVGPGVPIGAAFDLHGNLSAEMLAELDVAIACKEYPHIDFADAGRRVADVLLRSVSGDIVPQITALSIPMVAIAPTSTGPMAEFLTRLRAVEASPGVLAASALTGFFGADHPGVGAMILLVTDGPSANTLHIAQALADAFIVAVSRSNILGLDIERALDAAAATEGRVVIADRSDNAGGGAASDSTHILSALLTRGVTDAALGMIWDPVAVDFCHAAGVGARLPLRIGGKVGPLSGLPLDLDATVLSVRADVRQAWFGRGEPALPIGRSAAIRANGIDIVLNDQRHQVFSRHAFEEHGISLENKKLIVVKSTAHFREAFAPLGKVIDCDAPGTLSMDFSLLPYRRRPRPLWPIDPGPIKVRQAFPVR